MGGLLTVSHICNLICLSSIVIIREPNSTPIVRSWTGWKRLSVNWSKRQLFPTPERGKERKMENENGLQEGIVDADGFPMKSTYQCRLGGWDGNRTERKAKQVHKKHGSE